MGNNLPELSWLNVCWSSSLVVYIFTFSYSIEQQDQFYLSQSILVWRNSYSFKRPGSFLNLEMVYIRWGGGVSFKNLLGTWPRKKQNCL